MLSIKGHASHRYRYEPVKSITTKPERASTNPTASPPEAWWQLESYIQQADTLRLEYEWGWLTDSKIFLSVPKDQYIKSLEFFANIPGMVPITRTQAGGPTQFLYQSEKGNLAISFQNRKY
jgi:hypothetical protein